MPTLIVRNAVLLAEVESVEGTDPTPLPGTDAILIEQPFRITFNPNIIDTTEVNPSLDPFDPIVGGMSAQIEFDVYLKGKGTAGQAPEWGTLLRACGFAQTLTATAIPAAPQALAAGASMVQATLGTTASATADLYRGMPVSFSSAVTLDTLIWDYSAAKLAKITNTASASLTTTSLYQIPAHAQYAPASSSIPSLTFWIYNDGLLYKFVGCRGNASVRVNSGGPGRLSFRFLGQFTTKTDAATPTTTVVYDTTRPPIWKGGSFTIDSVAAAGSTFTLDFGNQLTQPDNPNATEGFDPGIITSRMMRGSIDPKETLVATRDIMASFRAATKAPLAAHWGTTAGNRIGLVAPSALYLNQTPGERNGYRTVEVPFHATGRDAGFYIICW
jgi:hypothetical protein